MKKSIWQTEIEAPKYKTLTKNIKTDVLIIGGGMAGILCGHRLKNAGVDYVIAEAKRILGGVTQCTTAKVTCHHGAVFDKMITRYGVEQSKLYLRGQQTAVAQIRALAQNIDCDFEDTVSYVYSRTDRKKIEKEVKALEKLGAPVGFTTETELPFPVAGAVKMTGQGQLHPLKFAYALAKDLNILEDTEILDITEGGAVTTHGTIRAKKIIVATHFPFLNRHGMYFLKMYQHRSYVLGLENAPKITGIYVDEAEKGLSFRSYRDLLLLGGGGHRTGKSGGGWQELSRVASTYYPDAKEICRYATQDCKTLDDLPYIGLYSESTPDLYVSTGFNKWGMSTSMLAANILTDSVCERENEYTALFSPSRSMLHKQLFVNAGESVIGLINPFTPRCSHLGCALTYNRQEHSWDCCCHGSRFASDGRVINNPAIKGIKIKK